MKKVLFIATVLKTHINAFHKPYLKMFQEQGYEVSVCAKNDYNSFDASCTEFIDNYYDINFSRSPLGTSNYGAYKKIKKIINDNQFDIIHCHTPVGGVLGRLAARQSRKKGTRIFYTAHGFHFFKGSPLKNWLLFYPIEWYLSKYTDTLITLNQEDYNIAKTFKLNHNLKVRKVDGVGVDLSKFHPINTKEKLNLRKKYGYNSNDFILIYVAELINRKNQKFIIESAVKLKHLIPNLVILLVGSGVNYQNYKSLIDKLDLNDTVKLLGFRKDVPELLQLSDIAVSASKHEGLPVNIIEAMATGLPIVVSNCRGNRDLGASYDRGVVFDEESSYFDLLVHTSISAYKLDLVHNNKIEIQKHSVKKVLEIMKQIYQVN